MRRALVTGAAGFIGSTLAENLVDAGWSVVGVDNFSDYYPEEIKSRNLERLLAEPRFELFRDDLATMALDHVIQGVDTVFHQAAQAGVRGSWATGFARYVHDNVHATQRLLEASVRADVSRVVYASSSSVYGNAESYPCVETQLTRPFSPYGVSKLAAEHLCLAYSENYALTSVALRYFTVYGPRQRPDMAIQRLIQSALSGEAFQVFGDGTAVRNFTYVGDVAAANVAAASATLDDGHHFVINIAGGSEIGLDHLISAVEQVTQRPIARVQKDQALGDVKRTGASVERAQQLLGWRPSVELTDGLSLQVDWNRNNGSLSRGAWA